MVYVTGCESEAQHRQRTKDPFLEAARETMGKMSKYVAKVPDASAQQVTIEKLLPLQNLKPGQYTLKMKVTDRNRNQTLIPSATFTVN